MYIFLNRQNLEELQQAERCSALEEQVMSVNIAKSNLIKVGGKQKNTKHKMARNITRRSFNIQLIRIQEQ